MNAMRQAHAAGWCIVIDTLTLADDRLDAFYDNPNALRDYYREIGRMVIAAEGRKANELHAVCDQYFCVTEDGTANGRLHFHAGHCMGAPSSGSVEPNFGLLFTVLSESPAWRAGILHKEKLGGRWHETDYIWENDEQKFR
ncbi:replication endonuclease [Bacillus mojavensis]|nr:replication endonuclease [Bacillus mojavensis]